MKIKLEDFDVEQELAINQRADLKIKGGKYDGKYSTQIVDTRGRSSFVVNAPFKQGEVVSLGTNRKVELVVRRENGVYSIPAIVKSRGVDVTPVLVLEVSGTVYKIQEREFFRLNIFERTEFRVLGKEVDLQGLEAFKKAEEIYEANVEDISGGGLGILTKKSVNQGEIVEVGMDFAELSFATAFGKVVRLREETKNEEKYYSLGIEFIDLNKVHQEELISWLFDKQRELRKKGLI